MAETQAAPDEEQVALDKFGFFLDSNDINVTKDSVMTPEDLATLRERERKWKKMFDRWSDWMGKRQARLKERCRKGLFQCVAASAHVQLLDMGFFNTETYVMKGYQTRCAAKHGGTCRAGTDCSLPTLANMPVLKRRRP
jgi:hypothetical protein